MASLRRMGKNPVRSMCCSPQFTQSDTDVVFLVMLRLGHRTLHELTVLLQRRGTYPMVTAVAVDPYDVGERRKGFMADQL
jgi:hypothetical protein